MRTSVPLFDVPAPFALETVPGPTSVNMISAQLMRTYRLAGIRTSTILGILLHADICASLVLFWPDEVDSLSYVVRFILVEKVALNSHTCTLKTILVLDFPSQGWLAEL